MGDRAKAVQSARALAVATLGSKFLGFGAQLVLARLLFEAEFGLFAFAVAISSLLGTLCNFEARRDILRSPDCAARKGKAYALLGLTLGGAIGIAIYVLAPVLVESLAMLSRSEDGLGLSVAARAEFLRLFCLLPLLEAVRQPLFAVVESRLAFDKLARLELQSSAVQLLLSCSLAALGMGASSLTLGLYAASCLRLLGGLALGGVDLIFERVRREDLASILFFGLPLLLANLLTAWFWKVDDVLVASVLGLAAGGIYSIAFEIPRALLQVTDGLSRVGLGFLGRHGETATQARIFSVTVRVSFALLAPFLIVGAVHAETILRILFGARWVPAAGAFQVFLVLCVLRGSLRPWADVASSRGRPELITRSSFVTALLLPLIGLPLMHAFGLVGMAAAVLLTWCVPAPFYLAWVRRELDLRFCPLLRPLAVALSLALALGFVLSGVGPLRGDAARILVMAVQVSVFYVVLLLLDRELGVLLREAMPRRAGGHVA